MSIDITVHHRSDRDTGIPAAVPALPIVTGQRGLAAGVASNVINGPCDICVVSDADTYLAMSTAPDLTGGNPATSPIRLLANSERWFSLPSGSHYLKVA